MPSGEIQEEVELLPSEPLPMSNHCTQRPHCTQRSWQSSQYNVIIHQAVFLWRSPTGITSSSESPSSHKLVFLVGLIVSMIDIVFMQAGKLLCPFIPLHYLSVMSDIWLQWPCWVNLLTPEGNLSCDNDQLKPLKWPAWLRAGPDLKTTVNLHSMDLTHLNSEFVIILNVNYYL